MHDYSKIDTNEFKHESWSSYGKKQRLKLTHSLTECADHQIISSTGVRNVVWERWSSPQPRFWPETPA